MTNTVTATDTNGNLLRVRIPTDSARLLWEKTRLHDHSSGATACWVGYSGRILVKYTSRWDRGDGCPVGDTYEVFSPSKCMLEELPEELREEVLEYWETNGYLEAEAL